MATIIPFKGIRPAKDKVHLVASRSVDGYSTIELQEKLETNPYSFLHVINPDFSDGEKTKSGSVERLQKIKKQYLKFISDRIFIPDINECYYVYQQIKNKYTFTGIIGCSSIDDYLQGVIKIHEQTITEREEKLMHYLEVCDFNAEPVLFCYPDNSIIERITKNEIIKEPVFDFSTTDKVHHKLWIISDIETINQLKKEFKSIPNIYIADGHHRSASSTLLGVSKRRQIVNYTGKEAFNYYLGIFFPESQLKIYDFNRIVKDLNRLSTEDFVRNLEHNFSVVKIGETVYSPISIHNFSMYIDGNWYSLQAKKEIIVSNEPVGNLDSSILTKHILSPILNIHDLKTNKRISFVAGIKGMEELKNQVDNNGFKVAFGLYPVEMKQLKHIADTNNIMPPKTTWVEPKIRSGLVVYSLSD